MDVELQTIDEAIRWRGFQPMWCWKPL